MSNQVVFPEENPHLLGLAAVFSDFLGTREELSPEEIERHLGVRYIKWEALAKSLNKDVRICACEMFLLFNVLIIRKAMKKGETAYIVYRKSAICGRISFLSNKKGEEVLFFSEKDAKSFALSLGDDNNIGITCVEKGDSSETITDMPDWRKSACAVGENWIDPRNVDSFARKKINNIALCSFY